jgi:hypothetical protein
MKLGLGIASRMPLPASCSHWLLVFLAHHNPLNQAAESMETILVLMTSSS